MLEKPHRIARYLQTNPFLMLDGGLATLLEERGYSLDTPLWSAELLLNQPDAIRECHLAYLRAGARCLISASYQGSIAGFQSFGLSVSEAGQLLQSSVYLALEAVEAFAGESSDSTEVLVAASIGPYGAVLADGSEYVGDYGLSEQQLYEFHQPRWQLLLNSGAHLLACETIPSFSETCALKRLFEESAPCEGWVSFTTQDGKHLSDGTALEKCAELLADCTGVVAIGINCSAPSCIPGAIDRLKGLNKEIVVYPNSGERYCAQSNTWQGLVEPVECAEAAGQWLQQGARLIGGCCRMGPAHISAMRQQLVATAGARS